MESVPRVISLSPKNTLLFNPAEVSTSAKIPCVCIHFVLYNRR